MKNVCAVILAAGDARRLRSTKPKALCEVLFKPMLGWVTDSLAAAGIENICVVVREHDDQIPAALGKNCAVAFQSADRSRGYGTGYAAMMAAEYIKEGGFEDVVVLFGDAPFVSAEVVENAYRQHMSQGNRATVISAKVQDPTGYGRIIRAQDGKVNAIVEEKDATEPERAVNEINSGDFWFKAASLLDFFRHMTNNNAQGEYYLTDTVEYLLGQGESVGAYVADSMAVLGANDRKGLAALNRIALGSILDRHMENGVDIPIADGIIIGPDVEIGPDTRILPGTVLRGRTVIGAGSEIGPNSYLDNAVVGDGCRVLSSYIESSTVEDGARIGPMSNIRPGCVIKREVKIGDFVEVKNSVVGENTSLAHLTYIGDSDLGARCNFGCGVVTTNYDGTNKFRTTVGDGVFVGCNVNLVPPVTVGDGAYLAAGTTITEDVPAEAMAIGRVRQEVKEGWAAAKGLYKK